jgi:NAD(P)-dependent dehydrogenase (short-subunit alcohol dehydrogenase family)
VPQPELDGKVALITGCGKADGLGAAIARSLSRAGARILVTDVVMGGLRNDVDDEPAQDGGLAARVDELRGSGGDAEAVLGDVRREADCAAMVAAAVERWNRLDILVSNSGAPHGQERSPITDVPVDAWDDHLDINLRGGFLMARAAIPAMRRSGGGRIIFTSSIAATRGVAYRAVYSASKAGLLGLVCSLAVEVGGDGITVNAVCPGLIMTSRVRSSAVREAGADGMEGELERRSRVVPVGRLGRPEDVAGVVHFLATDSAAYVTGQAIAVDGGLSIRLPSA